jgi:hypothetical protein
VAIRNSGSAKLPRSNNSPPGIAAEQFDENQVMRHHYVEIDGINLELSVYWSCALLWRFTEMSTGVAALRPAAPSGRDLAAGLGEDARTEFWSYRFFVAFEANPCLLLRCRVQRAFHKGLHSDPGILHR